MPVTLTIRNVPDALARKLKSRAQRDRRSLQRQLIVILEEAAAAPLAASEPPKRYEVGAVESQSEGTGATAPPRSSKAGKLTLRDLWERSRRLGLASPDESAAIIRQLRDERYRR